MDWPRRALGSEEDVTRVVEGLRSGQYYLEDFVAHMAEFWNRSQPAYISRLTQEVTALLLEDIGLVDTYAGGARTGPSVEAFLLGDRNGMAGEAGSSYYEIVPRGQLVPAYQRLYERYANAFGANAVYYINRTAMRTRIGRCVQCLSVLEVPFVPASTGYYDKRIAYLRKIVVERTLRFPDAVFHSPPIITWTEGLRDTIAGLPFMPMVCTACRWTCLGCDRPLGEPEAMTLREAHAILVERGCLACLADRLTSLEPPKPGRKDLRAFRTTFALPRNRSVVAA